jgi:hypothetical protein
MGIIRGHHRWHATFNRISILQRLIDSEFYGWVCYLDADAFIADLDFDLRHYLSDKEDIALIAADAGTGPHWWNVNAGVFLLNLAHPLGRAITREWYDTFSGITEDALRELEDWSKGPQDQFLLHQVLRSMPYAEKHTIVERVAPRLINYRNGRFIKQILRAQGSFEERVEALRLEVNRVLGVR